MKRPGRSINVRAALQALARRARMAVAKAVVDRVEGGGLVPRYQVVISSQETRSGIPAAEPYGFASGATEGVEGVAAFVNGHRDHGFLVGFVDRRRPATEGGEVVIHSPEHGQSIRLGADGAIELTAGSSSIRVVDGEITITAAAIKLETP